jgi:hypothetical protein
MNNYRAHARARMGHGYRRFLGSLPSRGFTGSGFQPAMVRAHFRASASSVTPGNNRRSSTAAANSPPWSKAVPGVEHCLPPKPSTCEDAVKQDRSQEEEAA